jgi:RNA polymerase sigma-70 factor (ECF subfamily)
VDSPSPEKQLDGASVMAALQKLDETYRAPLALFYLEEHSYRDIAEILEIPIGTVMSRISRGKQLLRKTVLEKDAP